MEKEKFKAIFSRIGLKLIVPYLIISFFILILIAGLIYYNYNVQINSIQEVQEEISLKASSEIHYYIKNIIDGLNLLSREIGETNRFDKILNMKTLKNLIDHDPSVYSVSIVNLEGNEITKIVRYDPRASLELKDISTQEKFRKAFEGDLYLSNVYISEFQLPFFSIALPIYDENNTKIGVLAAEVDLSPMWDTISKIKVKKTGYVYVVDEHADLIAYKDVNLVKKHLDLSQYGGVKNFLNNIRKSETYISFNNEKVIGNWKLIEAAGWGVIVELPTKEVFQELSVLLIIGGITIIVFFSFIVIILIIIFKKLLKPLSYLQKGVTEVRSGNLNYKMKIVSKDELGDLGETFNQMTKDLKQSHLKIKKHEKELESIVEKRTKELNDKVKELEETRTAILNILEDVNLSKERIEKSEKELLKVNKDIQKANVELLKIDKTKNEFISVTAHELKTPLASIHGFASLLQNKKILENKKQRDYYLNIIMEDSERLKKLINDILDLSRLDLGSMKFLFEKISVRDVLKALLKELDVTARKKGLILKANAASNVPNIIIADKSRLIQVLANLVSNAVKYSPKKGSKIIVSAAKQGKFILFSVKDQGTGIPKKYINMIFDRFYQVDSSYTRKVGGTGLGLAICKGIVEAMHGEIWVKSTIGRGSTFSFTVPVKSKMIGEEELKLFKKKKK